MSIESLIEHVLPDCTGRFDCPVCGGNKSLSISKYNGNVLYRCFKASCTLKPSKLFVPMTVTEIQNRIASKTALGGSTAMKVPFKLPDYWIQGLASKKCFQMLLKHNAIDSYMKGLFKIAYDPKQDRLVYLIQDDKGNIVGGIGRAMSNQLPKTYNYPTDTNMPFMCGNGGTAVLVEDCASACSIARLPDYTGIALLGTEVSTEYLSYIVFNFPNIIIALDKDAFHKAIKLRKRITAYVDAVSIWKLNKDLKELSKQEIADFIKIQYNIIS